MHLFSDKKSKIPTAAEALPGRDTIMLIPEYHYVNGAALSGPFASNLEKVIFGIGCFWGAERIFWQLPGVYVTAVGYAGGHTPNPTYEEICTGQTGHNEVVIVIYDPTQIKFDSILKTFWESHDPTQGMSQGNDVGTQYRSGVYCSTIKQQEAAETSRKVFQKKLKTAGFGTITTEILNAPSVYYAEDYHQQYLAKNPNGYCGLGGTGVTLSI
jgi:peptide-methionine (S)-S-oxide reductase